MRRIFTFVFVLFLCKQVAIGQADYAIGTGTIGNTNTSYPAPLQDYFEGSRMQYLYKASELMAAGMNQGFIFGLKYNVTALNGAGLIENFSLKIGTTTANTLGTTTWDNITNPATLGPINYQPVLGVNTFTFAAPYLWNGTDNIIIEICGGDPNNATTGLTTYTFNPSTPWTTGLTFNGSHTYRADNLGNLCNTATTTNTGTQTTRPNIIFSWGPASPCTEPPTPGTSVANPSLAICGGTPVNLSLSGNSQGGGQTYLWQSSPTLGGPYTNIGTASPSSVLTVSPTITTYYRAEVTCGGTSLFSTPVQVTVTTPFPAGSYTINSGSITGGNNFQSFEAAINAISCGIAGPVVFDVIPGSGPYAEQIEIPQIGGTSATNTITFNGNGNIIQFNNTTDARHIIQFNGADYVTFNNVKIVALNTTYGWGVHLQNGSNFNRLNNCTIDLSLVTSTIQSNSGGIVASSSGTSVTVAGNNANNFIANADTIIGGYQGVIMYGSTGGLDAVNNRISNCVIKDFYGTAIFLNNHDGPTVTGNNISRAARTIVGTFIGIEIATGTRNANINANRIHDTHNTATTQTGLAYGIYINSADAPVGSENKITNNLIYNFNSLTGTMYGIYNAGADGAFIYHNTIALTNPTSTDGITRGFYQLTAASNIKFINNIVFITRGGMGVKYALYFGTTTSAINSNNNLLFIGAPAGTNGIGFYGTTAYPTLANWQTANGGIYDLQSVTINPLFTNPAVGDYTPTEPSINNTGANVGIATDLNGQPRTVTTPDIGAIEFSVNPCTAPPTPGAAMAIPNTAVCATTPVVLNITGNSIGLNQTYVWQSSPTLGGTYTNISASSNLTSYTTNPIVTAYYRAAVTCGSSTTYSTPVLVNVNPAFAAGSYTINSALPTGGINFQSFTEVVNALKCGINGPVVFNVAPGSGPYDEQVILPVIIGSSATNTITFNGNGETLSFISTNTNQRAVIKLDGADYVTFDSLTIRSGAAGSIEYGYGVQLINDADNNTIRRCKIDITTIGATASYAGIVINSAATSATTAGNTFCDNNTITGNTITGGYYGITLVGNGATAPINNNKVTNNTISDFYQYGIYLNGNTNTLIEKNIISRPTRPSVTTFYGIYSTGISSGLNISKNRIRTPFGGIPTSASDAYGIYFTTTDAVAANANTITNNLISNFVSAGSQYGLYNAGSDNAIYLHNTISFNDTAIASGSEMYGFYQTTAAVGLRIENNIFSFTGSSASTATGVFLNTAASNLTIDRNAYFFGGNGLAGAIGSFNGAGANSLATWQAASGFDINSVNADPLFVNPAAGNYMPRNVEIDNKGGNAGITTDILDAPRSVATPDPGAYEFIAPPCVAPPTPGAAKVSFAEICPGTLVTVTLAGNSFGVGQTYILQRATSLTGPYTNVSGVLTSPTFVDSPRTRSFYRYAVSCGTSTSFSLADSVKLLNCSATSANGGLSNKGTNFWVGYGHNQLFGGNGQQMVLYLSAEQPAQVTVKVNGTTWTRTYNIPANSVVTSDPLPKAGVEDSRLLNEGLSNKGIQITSNVPIVAYAHEYGSASSGATMLLPVETYGYQYFSLNARQYYTSDSYSWFYVVAHDDNTRVEITPSALTRGGRVPNVPFIVNLNKGEIYQVLGAIQTGSTGFDLTGSKIRSVANAAGICKTIGVFSGSSRTALCNTTNGDIMIQQIFPASAWGNRYLAFPTVSTINTQQFNGNIFRVAVRDPSTIVKRNGVVLTGLNNNFYYEFNSNQPEYIEADKSILVAQYMTSTGGTACTGISNTGLGDPEMFYLSPIEQAIGKVTFFNTANQGITSNYVNVIVPTAAVPSTRIDNTTSWDYTFPHPRLPGYTGLVKKTTAGQHSINSSLPFTAITYGMGSVESYGYNAGTLVNNLSSITAIQNSFSDTSNEFTCLNSPFRFSMRLNYKPTKLVWQVSQAANISPNTDVTDNNPIPVDTTIVSGRTYYRYVLNQLYNFSDTGNYTISVLSTSPALENCDNTETIQINVRVNPSPVASFTFSFTGCRTDTARFFGSSTSGNYTFNRWQWDFDDATTSALQNPLKLFSSVRTYNVKLRGITTEGCIDDTTRPVVVSTPVVAKFGFAGTRCVGSTITFSDSSTSLGGAINLWYWDFGNGRRDTVTTNAPRNVVYTAAGTYTVTLIAQSAGCKSEIFSRTITIAPSPRPDFSFPAEVCLPGGVQFTNLTTISDGTIGTVRYVWQFGDNTSDTARNPIHVYIAQGPYNVTLTATSANGCVKDTTKTINNIIPVVNVFPFKEGFEGTAFPPSGWTITQAPIDSLLWKRVTAPRILASEGLAAAFMNNYRYAFKKRTDNLNTPVLKIPKSDSVLLKFDVAALSFSYPGSTAIDMDTLDVELSYDCGQSWQSVYKKTGFELQTINDPNFSNAYDFYPIFAGQWRSDSVKLTTLVPNGGDIRLRFRNTGNGENNIFIDNINLSVKNLTDKIKANGFVIYPIPFRTQFYVQHYLPPTDLVGLEVYNAIGQRVIFRTYSGNADSYIPVNLAHLADGMYVIKLKYTNRSISTKVLKQH